MLECECGEAYVIKTRESNLLSFLAGNDTYDPDLIEADQTRRTVDLGHSSDGPSWIDLAAIRVNTTESRLLACLNRLPQQNRHLSDMRGQADDVRSEGKSKLGGRECRFPILTQSGIR
jgi:hypothetical protein